MPSLGRSEVEWQLRCRKVTRSFAPSSLADITDKDHRYPSVETAWRFVITDRLPKWLSMHMAGSNIGGSRQGAGSRGACGA